MPAPLPQRPALPAATHCRYYTGRFTPHLLWLWHFVLWGLIIVGENVGRRALRWAEERQRGGTQLLRRSPHADEAGICGCGCTHGCRDAGIVVPLWAATALTLTLCEQRSPGVHRAAFACLLES